MKVKKSFAVALATVLALPFSHDCIAKTVFKAVIRVKGFRTAEVIGKGVTLDATNGISGEWESYGVRLYRLKK